MSESLKFAAPGNSSVSSMRKVVHALAGSSRGRSILRMSTDELLTSLFQELLSSTTILKPGRYSVSLGKVWACDGAETLETTVTLSFSAPVAVSRGKARAVQRLA